MRMTRRWLTFLSILAICSGIPQAETGTITVDRAVIARSVENRKPVGEASHFAADVGKIVCFTKIEGATDDTVIYHVWRHGETLLAKVQLSVRSSLWRTWSKKWINPAMTGTWTVDIEDADGDVLKTLSFTIGEEEEEDSESPN